MYFILSRRSFILRAGYRRFRAVIASSLKSRWQTVIFWVSDYGYDVFEFVRFTIVFFFRFPKSAISISENVTANENKGIDADALQEDEERNE